MKIDKFRPFLLLAAIAASLLTATPVMAVTGLDIPSGGTVDLNGATMDLGCGDLVVNGTLNLDSGTMNKVGSVIIGAAGIINGGSGSINLSDNWTNNNGAAGFVAGTSQVTWNTECGNDTIIISGDTTFWNLTITTASNPGRQVTFAAGSTTTVEGHLILNGTGNETTPATLLKIRSSAPGTPSFLVVTGTFAVVRVDVSDNHATLPGQWIDLGPPGDFDSIDSGGNFRWFSSAAIFVINKVWNESGDTGSIPVSAHLSCTGVTPAEQNVVFTATTAGVLIVENIDIANGLGETVDCTITETVPANHTADYACGDFDADSCSDSSSDPVFDGCFFVNVEAGGDKNECSITNTPKPATVTVFKDWTVAGSDQGFDGDYHVEITCDGGDNHVVIGNESGIVIDSFTYCSGNGPNDHCDAEIWSSFDQGDGWVEFSLANPSFGAQCVVLESFDDNVIDSSNDCEESFDVGAGADIECHIDNTVFFEGIPTLSQYGMAILALLMLGVGMIGFRRSV